MGQTLSTWKVVIFRWLLSLLCLWPSSALLTKSQLYCSLAGKQRSPMKPTFTTLIDELERSRPSEDLQQFLSRCSEELEGHPPPLKRNWIKAATGSRPFRLTTKSQQRQHFITYVAIGNEWPTNNWLRQTKLKLQLTLRLMQHFSPTLNFT